MAAARATNKAAGAATRLSGGSGVAQFVDPPGYSVPVICAWCGADLGRRAGYPAPMATHGMCARCAAEFLAGLERPAK
jgi:hypothetical protein